MLLGELNLRINELIIVTFWSRLMADSLTEDKTESMSQNKTFLGNIRRWFLAGILLILILVTNSLINFPNTSDESALLDNNIISEEINESFIDEVPENQENLNN